MTTQTITRREEIQAIWKQHQWLYVLVGVMLGLLIFPFLDMLAHNLSELLSGLVPEAIGIIFTVLIIDQLNQQREDRRRVEDFKQRLIRDAGSTVHNIAIKAIEDLRAHGWLTSDKSILKGENLQNANLETANLSLTNLSKAYLISVNLSKASLMLANLSGANLWHTNLSEAVLRSTNLSGTDLVGANLSGTDLVGANLSGADMREANLENAKWSLGGRKSATLPDGTKWTSDTDMGKFTDPEHPEFQATLEKINAIRAEMGLRLLV